MLQRCLSVCKRSSWMKQSRFSTAAAASMEYTPLIGDIKKLRETSEAPIADCKKALIASKGDFPEAFEWLRKKGIASATKKAGRTTAEGLVGGFVSGKVGSLVEINSETDFVAMNEKFQQLVSQLSVAVFKHAGAVDMGAKDLLALPVSTDEGLEVAVSDIVPILIGKVGENVSVRRAQRLEVENGIVCSYIHNAVSNGLGKAGALVAIEADSPVTDDAIIKEMMSLGHRLAMHIVASKPTYLKRELVPEVALEKERNFLLEQVAGSGKPQDILNKMVEGRLNKFYGEICLLDQNHVVEEGNPKVSKVVESASKKLGVSLSVKGFSRYQVGEEETN